METIWPCIVCSGWAPAVSLDLQDDFISRWMRGKTDPATMKMMTVWEAEQRCG